jgi:hypothetical protein
MKNRHIKLFEEFNIEEDEERNETPEEKREREKKEREWEKKVEDEMRRRAKSASDAQRVLMGGGYKGPLDRR